MNLFHLFLGAMVIVSAGVAVFGSNFRLRIISVWVTSLVLSFVFLNLKNELLALTLCFTSTAVSWAVLTQALVFGEIQKKTDQGPGWRGQIMPVTGALMFLAILALALPAVEIPADLAIMRSEPVVASEFGKQVLGKFFLFAVVVAGVTFAAIVGVGMVARSEWKGEES